MAASSAPKQRQLLQQAEKILLHPIHAHLITYCPTMDLIALVTDEENLDVYRINGQRAFGLKRKSEDVCVDMLQWEFNGKSIAVSWSDGSTDLVNAETGKVSHKDLMIPGSNDSGNNAGEKRRVKCMGWGLNFIDVDAVKRRTGGERERKNEDGEKDVFGQPTTEDWDAFMDDTTVEDFLQRQPDFQTLDIAPDLPDQLAMMDMEMVLPKLPAIPLPPALPFMRVSAADTGAFSTQPEVDSLLHSHHTKDQNSVDMFIRCSDRGTIHPSIYDSMETVDVHLPKAWNMTSTPLLHTSHPYSCSHGLLMRATAPASHKSYISFIPLTLNFIPSAGIYLHLIASKTSQLQNLLLYITQTLQRIRTFFKHSQDLPSKFMMNISETLEEKSQGNLMTNLFHIACTGNTPPLIREWLVDDLAEQGHKRWDNTVTTSLTTLLALIHENLIPALDRCSIVISRLRGLAQFHERDWIFACPITDFSDLLEVLKNMRFLAHTALLYAGEEKKQFHAFSKWLRYVIDFEATEPDSQSRAEMESRDPGVDIQLVLEYIRYGLQKSDLQPFLKPEAQLGQGKREVASYEDTKKAVEVVREGGAFMEESVCLEYVLGHLRDGVSGLLRQVSAWQEANIRIDSGIVLEESADGEDGVVDMRMLFEPHSPSTISTFIALASPSAPTSLHIHALTHAPSISSLSKDLHAHAATTLFFPSGTIILDAKFADDKTLLLLLSTPPPNATDKTNKATAEHIIISIPYKPASPHQHPPQSKPVITYTPLPASDSQAHALPSGTPVASQSRTTLEITSEQITQCTAHVFEGRFAPLKMVVNGRKGRRVIVVLGSDRKHYRVLDMDFRERKGHNEGGGEGQSGSESESEDDGGADADVEMGGI